MKFTNMILVFKTSINTKNEVESISPTLDELLVNATWNFDLKDRDNILRVDTRENVAGKIIIMLEGNGFMCEELV